jgi:cyclohexadienyl dehydratase
MLFMNMTRLPQTCRVLLRACLGVVWTGGLVTAAGAGTLDDVRASGILKVCMWPQYFGISYQNPRTGTLQGLDIDLSQALASDLGVRLEHVPTDFTRVIDDLEARRCQVAMMGVGVTPARAARVDFSAPYLRSDLYAVATRANTAIQRWEDIDQPGRVVVVQRGTIMEPAMQRTLKQATLRVVDRPSEREREVESGRADVFITDYPYSTRMLKNTDWARVIPPSGTVQLTDYAYAVPKGDAAWLARINRFVADIKRDGRLARAATPHDLTPILVKD